MNVIFFFSSLMNKQLGRRLIDSLLPKQPRFQSNIRSIARIFQIWPALVGYEELAGGLEPIRNGEKF